LDASEKWWLGATLESDHEEIFFGMKEKNKHLMSIIGTTTYENTLTLIRVYRSFPIGAGAQIINGYRFVAYSPTAFYNQLLVVFPDSTLTLADVTAYLALGAKKGIFTIVACVDGVPQYIFNNGLVGSNYQNIAYLQACATWNGVVPGNCSAIGQTTGLETLSAASTSNSQGCQGSVFVGANNIVVSGCGVGNGGGSNCGSIVV
jgi:hypothetical protein